MPDADSIPEKETATEAPAKTRRLRLEVTAALLASFIAALALVVSCYSAAAGARVETLHVLDESLAKSLASQVHRLTMVICYCSVLDECWSLRSDPTRNEPVAACPTGPTAFKD
ncbi:hypothetical protein LZC95_28040 [Pendulispora brunnea]|uniref:Uncharacterized protein n=1 Tax=Pendulispora brunnea TaxID=2905690 RepID=A0ABZ2JV15_9BACT